MSASVMEPYDAQMIDYSTDIDVPMQTTVSSPKAWPPPEAAMEDDTIDTHPIVDATPSQQKEDVEIEMEPYYEETVEYEMEDDYNANDELVDVEVYDAPRDSDPVAGEPSTSSHSPGPSQSELPPSTAEQLPPFAQHPPVMEHENVILDASPLPNPSPYTPSPHTATEPAPHHLPAEETSELPTILEPNPDSLAHSSAYDSSGVLPTAEPAAVNDEPDGPVLEEHAESRAASASAEPKGVSSAEQLPAADHRGQDPSHVEGEETDRQPDISGLETVDFTHLQQSADGLDTLATSEPEAVHEAPGFHEEDLNPHEVAEGVFIEPPPAVLLELSSSSDQPECCLFNAPIASGSVSPHGLDFSSRFEVLLAHRPTLYYERLSDVFEALREEERIQRLAEFAEGEMVLDAYDLQLAVSEDNIYAREVTLHDLNILHDGTDFTGPLRIRLRFIMPRFIGRYHLLRDQISRLNLAEDGEEVYNQAEPNYEDVHEEFYQENTSDEQAQAEEGQAEAEAENGDESTAQVTTADSTGHVDDATDTNHPEHVLDHQDLPQDEPENEPTSEAFATDLGEENAVSATAGEDTDYLEAHAEVAAESEVNAEAAAESEEAVAEDELEYTEASYEGTQESPAEVDGNPEEYLESSENVHSVQATSLETSPRPPDGVQSYEEPHEEDGIEATDLHLSKPDFPEHVTDDYEDGNPGVLTEDMLNETNEKAESSHDDDLRVLDPESKLAGDDNIQNLDDSGDRWEEQDVDGSWEEDVDAVDEETGLPDTGEHDAASTESSTLSSKTAYKRAFDETGFEDVDELGDDAPSPATPPGPKRTRMH
ncbi:hypothetical protein EVG20_g5578 [Dentipellis fragilis]|uniref:Uncharacterized protein n=1 Tax=Dentipellis fragilis TaxID=205917 RepID=A0A4Y9YSA8_9AGAM|nr:hypothetical protein EVG20_g5578 [Dentipellis fragilis]